MKKIAMKRLAELEESDLEIIYELTYKYGWLTELERENAGWLPDKAYMMKAQIESDMREWIGVGLDGMLDTYNDWLSFHTREGWTDSMADANGNAYQIEDYFEGWTRQDTAAVTPEEVKEDLDKAIIKVKFGDIDREHEVHASFDYVAESYGKAFLEETKTENSISKKLKELEEEENRLYKRFENDEISDEEYYNSEFLEQSDRIKDDIQYNITELLVSNNLEIQFAEWVVENTDFATPEYFADRYAGSDIELGEDQIRTVLHDYMYDVYLRNFPGLEEEIEGIQAMYNRLLQADSADDLQEKIITFQEGLTTAHHHGTMADHLLDVAPGEGQAILDRLSNQDTSEWDKQVTTSMGYQPKEEEGPSETVYDPELQRHVGQQEITYAIEHNDSHGGTFYGQVLAIARDDVIGHLDFAYVSDWLPGVEQEDDEAEEIYIEMTEVDDAYRGRGIATGMFSRLKEEYPGTEIKFGMATDDGSEFIKSLGRESKMKCLADFLDTEFGVYPPMTEEDHKAVELYKDLELRIPDVDLPVPVEARAMFTDVWDAIGGPSDDDLVEQYSLDHLDMLYKKAEDYVMGLDFDQNVKDALLFKAGALVIQAVIEKLQQSIGEDAVSEIIYDTVPDEVEKYLGPYEVMAAAGKTADAWDYTKPLQESNYRFDLSPSERQLVEALMEDQLTDIRKYKGILHDEKFVSEDFFTTVYTSVKDAKDWLEEVRDDGDITFTDDDREALTEVNKLYEKMKTIKEESPELLFDPDLDLSDTGEEFEELGDIFDDEDLKDLPNVDFSENEVMSRNELEKALMELREKK